MSIKSFILATVVVATGSVAAADTYFENGWGLDSDDTLELGLITAAGAGVVEIYDYGTGQQGKLLGTERLNAGANTDVRVDTGFAPSRDVLAVVKIDGQIAASKRFDID